MIKRIVKRQLTLLMAVVLTVTMVIPIWLFKGMSADAANVTNFSVGGLTASYDTGSWTSGGTDLAGSATGKAQAGCDDATSVTSTLTLKNTKGSAALLTFNYAKPTIGSGGSVKIDGTAVTAAGSFSKELANNESITIVIVSGNPGAYTSSVSITDIQLVKQTDVTTTFEPAASGGSYSVDGTTVTSAYSNTQISTQAYNLKATAASGYKFFAWQSSTAGIISYNANYSAMFETDQTVTAIFLRAEDPVFQVGPDWFTDLNEADSYAVSHNINKIVLIANGTLPAGSYTISSGKTLLIPYDNAFTVSTTKPDIIASKTPTAPSVYKKLTMASGANLTVKGAVCVNAKVNSYNNAYTGVTTGKYGQIHMNDGSTMTVANGGNLYSWGYVTGSGAITAQSGANVYEPFQICDIRGGTATSGMNGNSQRVLPFSQYYVQNIEAPLTIMYGATETAVGSITIQSQTATPTAKFVGSSGSLFTLSSGGSFTKTYDPVQDRNYYDVEGNASVNSMSLNAYITINTANYVLPIMENTTMRVHSGTTTTNQDLCMIPGSEIEVDQGASVKVASGKNAYIYDRDQWVGGKYIYSNTDLKTSYYSPTRVNTNKFTVDKMVDARLDINGTVEAAGDIYTTESGADITSSQGTGKFLFTKAPTASKTTYQAVQSGTDITYTQITAVAPYLHNKVDDPEYTLTAGTSAGQYYSFCAIHGKWELGDPHEATYSLKNWQWADDYSSATAVWECDQNGETVETPATVTSSGTEPTCTEAGSMTYTATASMGDKTETDTKTVTKEALGHNYGEPTYTWSDDNLTVTAKKICANNSTHVIEETAETEYAVTTEPGCETAGVGTYTAAFGNSAFTTQTKTVALEATGHAYGAPQYEWSDDNSTVTATMTCANNTGHIVTQTVDTTSEVTKEPGCETKGERTYTASFTNSAFATQTKKVDIAATGHDYGKATYTWSDDNSSVTAQAVCSHDSSHIEKETVNTTYAVTIQPECETDGEGIYTAAFTKDLFSTQTKTVDIGATGHRYGTPQYEWSDDNSTVTATMTCANNTGHVVTQTVDTTSEVTKEPGCETKGERTYTASFTNSAFATQTKKADIAATGHKYGEPEYAWSDDKTSITAKVVCENNPDHVITETVDTTYVVTTEPGCETPGEGTYTAAFEDEHFTKQIKTEEIPATGHKFGEPEYTWSDDKTSVTAEMVCEKDGYSITETVDTTYAVTTEPGCETKGEGTYTAVFTKEQFSTQTKKVDLDATGHKYGEPEYTWSDDNASVTAKVVCANDSSHVIEETVATTCEETTAPGCETPGEGTYTATFKDEHFTKQTKTEEIPATGHNFGKPEYTWSDDKTSVTAEVVCEKDGYSITETVDTTYAVTTEPGCETKGEGTYTAVFTKEQFSTQTKKVDIAATGHDYGEPEYKWSDDNTKVTAKAVCANDSSHVIEETVDTTYKVTIEPGCESDGEGTYKALFTKELFSTQIKTVTIKATGHRYGTPEYEWTADNNSVTATAICSNDASHIVTETVKTTNEVTKQPGCETKGERTYTAVFTKEEFSTQTKKVDIDATGHKYGEPEYTWSDDKTSVTAKVVCENNPDHVITETVKTTSEVTKQPGCETKGERTYTAAFTKEQFSTQTKKIGIDPVGHKYSEPDYYWSEDNKEATAKIMCLRDPSHAFTERINTTFEVTKEPGCETKGEGIYIASFKSELFSEQTKKVEIEATGHDYGEPEYTWSEDNKQVTAKAVCANDDSHVITETADTTYEVTAEPTAEKEGTGVYTAAFDNKAFEKQTREVTIPATGHTYTFKEWKWESDYSAAAAVFLREDDETVETAAVITTETVPAACTEPGKNIYTASAVFNGEEYTDVREAVIEPAGHTFELTGWVWADDCSEAKAVFTCSACKITEEMKAQISSEKTDPACETEGKETFTASVSAGDQTFTDQREKPIAATGHKWDDGVVTKEAGLTTEGILTYTCQQCGQTREEVIPPINDTPGDGDAKDSVFNKLRFRSYKQTKSVIYLSWKTLKNADHYVLYGNRCGSKYKMKKLKTFTGNKKAYRLKKVLGKKVKKGTYYKLMLVAFDKDGKRLSTAKTLHVATPGGRVTNFKSVKTAAKKNRVTLKVGKTFKLRAKGVKCNAKLKARTHRVIKYELSRKGIAKVSKKGVVTGKAKGRCYVYVYAQNGVFKRIRVTVK